ncbi:hypothetical protein FIBSPDRAFT_723153, partial [Athelia psychrophila]
ANLAPSSIMSELTVRHRSSTNRRVFWKRILFAISLAASRPRPIPAQECKVVPPIFIAAMPVEAVIPSVLDDAPPNVAMISRNKTDLPVPSRQSYLTP